MSKKELAKEEYQRFLDSELSQDINIAAHYAIYFPKFVAMAALVVRFAKEIEATMEYHSPLFICEMAFDAAADIAADIASEDEAESN